MGHSVVVHLCSNFSMCCQMVPGQGIKFQTANFPIFCPHIIVIFWTTCIVMEVFSLVIMGNVTFILPVLHWLEVVIAFVSSYYYYYYYYYYFIIIISLVVVVVAAASVAVVVGLLHKLKPLQWLIDCIYVHIVVGALQMHVDDDDDDDDDDELNMPTRWEAVTVTLAATEATTNESFVRTWVSQVFLQVVQRTPLVKNGFTWELLACFIHYATVTCVCVCVCVSVSLCEWVLSVSLVPNRL